MAEEKQKPIVIKKIKKGDHAHHGGAWKVAYADFMTALMMFFLVMWLINATPIKALQGFADYFTPISAAVTSSGSDGMVAGQSVSEEKKSQESVENLERDVSSASSNVQFKDNKGSTSGPVEKMESAVVSEFERNSGQRGGEDYQKAKPSAATSVTSSSASGEKRENEEFKNVKKELEAKIKSADPDNSVSKNVQIDIVPEGLRIQFIDGDGFSMFNKGSVYLNEHAFDLLATVYQKIKGLDNKISIEGHTDSSSSNSDKLNSPNWIFSAQRADSVRKGLGVLGLKSNRIARIVGLADTAIVGQENSSADNDSNRRVSITLMRKSWQPAAVNSGIKNIKKGAHDIDELLIGTGQEIYNEEKVKEGDNVGALFEELQVGN